MPPPDTLNPVVDLAIDIGKYLDFNLCWLFV